MKNSGLAQQSVRGFFEEEGCFLVCLFVCFSVVAIRVLTHPPGDSDAGFMFESPKFSKVIGHFPCSCSVLKCF